MRYVAVFAFSASLAEFCVEDFLSAAEALGVSVVPLNAQAPWLSQCRAESQFYLFDSSASRQELVALAERCILLRGLYVLLQACASLPALYERRATIASDPHDMSTPLALVVGDAEQNYANGDFSYHVETIGKKYSGEAKKDIIEKVLSSSPLSQEDRLGRVNYTSPQHRFFVFIQHQAQAAPPGTKGFVPDGPVWGVVHAVQLVESGRSACLARYDLKWRPYVGTTSMPAEEALLMANAGRVKPGQLVMDPFCGTGSLLVAAAHHGAHTLGSDADGRAMRAGTAKGQTSPQLQLQRRLAMSHYSASDLALARISEEEQLLPSMITNFKLYRLPPPDRMRLNFSAWPRTWHARGGFLDAIITDPPYGLREPRKKTTLTASHEGGHDGQPSVANQATSAYHTNEVVLDLVLFAAEYLVVGGFLVFWHPTTDRFTQDELPTHPSLRLLSSTPQRLSLKVVRRLVVMVKTCAPAFPRPTREACAPLRSADDLRALMDVTEIPDNPSYTHYRQRVTTRREATSRFLGQQPQASHSSSQVTTPPGEAVNDGERTTTSATGRAEVAEAATRPVRGRRRIETQRYIVENRTRKLKLREERQKASHEANRRRQQMLNALARSAHNGGNDAHDDAAAPSPGDTIRESPE